MCLGVMQKVSKDIEVVIKKVIDSFGYDLWGVEFFLNNKSGPLLRIYIEVEGGVDISHCEKVSRQLSAVLDVEKVIASIILVDDLRIQKN